MKVRHKILKSFTILVTMLFLGGIGYGQEQEYLIASGAVKNDGSVKLQNFRKIMLPVGTDDESGVGSYSLELQNEIGTLLFARYFELRNVPDANESQLFLEKIPYHSKTNRIVLKHGEVTLKTLFVSNNRPELTITYPNGGESLSGYQNITWMATDVDGDMLSYDILYSKDGGNSWSAIAVGINQQKYLWNTNNTPGSYQALIRVLATDGVNTGQDDSDSLFTVTPKSPQVVISKPANNTVYMLGEPIIFTGHGFDFEDGPLEDNKLTWTSNIEGVIGSGSDIVLETLSSGTHNITLSADDSDGNHGTTNAVINVSSMQDSDGDRVEDDVDNCPKGYNPGQEDFDNDGIGDACDDSDRDGFSDSIDNCRLIPNDQTDSDNDGVGDACDIPGEWDTIPPTLDIKLSPLPNSLGWHNTNVSVGFICADFESGISVCPTPIGVSIEGVGMIITGTAVDQGGNASSSSVIINLDKTPPVVNTSFSALHNTVGWYNTDVTVTFNCYDAGSGISSCPEPITVTVEDVEQLITGTAIDLAENSKSKYLTINLDKTSPTITASPSILPNVFGWHNSNVTVSFICSDALSDISICSSPVVVSTEGAGQVITGTAVDLAGNSALTPVTINLDKTLPTIKPILSFLPNAAGWYKSDATVSFLCSDDTSGVTTCPNFTTTSTEGKDQIISGETSDKAGNSASASIMVSLDKTPPVLTMPILAPAYLYNSLLTFNFSAQDTLSGLVVHSATLNGVPIINGASVILTKPGTNTVILTATDMAGNSNTQTATFEAQYVVYGFLPPIQADGSKVFKLGSTIPIKFQLKDFNGADISTAKATLILQQYSNDTPVGDPVIVESTSGADTGNIFRYDFTNEQYIFNLYTKGLSQGLWQLQVHLDDGTTTIGFINLK